MLPWISAKDGVTEYWNYERRSSNPSIYPDLVEQKGRIGHNRKNMSKNRRRVLSNSTTLWIPPSTYQRGQIWWGNPSGGRWIRPGATPVYVTENFPWPTAVAVVLRNSGNPLWSDLGALSFSWPTNAYNRTVTEALLKLKDAKGDLGTNLATARQTYELLVGNAQKLWSLLIAMKHGNYGAMPRILGLNHPKRALRSASSWWLEYQYGVKPLVQDIYDLRSLLEEQLKPALLVAGRRTVAEPYSRSGKGNSGSNAITYTDRCKTSVRTQLYGRLSDQFQRDVARCGLSNPLSIAWELTPWSFFIDWSLPIGSVIEALDATRGLTFVGGWSTMRAVRSVSVSETYTGWTEESASSCSIECFGFKRDIFGSWPTPLPYTKSPFSSAHAKNALALLTQLLGRKPR